jgi:hypothetical protein
MVGKFMRQSVKTAGSTLNGEMESGIFLAAGIDLERQKFDLPSVGVVAVKRPNSIHVRAMTRHRIVSVKSKSLNRTGNGRKANGEKGLHGLAPYLTVYDDLLVLDLFTDNDSIGLRAERRTAH